MNKEQMIEALQNRGNEVANELRSLENEFNTKKEEFLKIQGALEALTQLDMSEDTTEFTE